MLIQFVEPQANRFTVPGKHQLPAIDERPIVRAQESARSHEHHPLVSLIYHHIARNILRQRLRLSLPDQPDDDTVVCGAMGEHTSAGFAEPPLRKLRSEILP